MSRHGNGNVFGGEIVFPEFPKEGRWRVVGFEAVQDYLGQPYERQVQWVFRRIENGKVEGSPLRIWGPVGWIPYVVIGSEWEGGRRVSDRFAGLEAFDEILDVSAARLTDIDVFQKYATPVDAQGRPVRKSYFWIPPYAHRFDGLTAERFRLVGIPHNGDPCGVLVPAYVLIQFYMAGSTTLAQALFRGSFAHLFDRAQSGFMDEQRRIFRIRLAPGVPYEDAWILARYLASKAGGPERAALARVWASLTRASVNRQPRLPSALFPIDGETRLRARGVWLPSSPQDGSRPRHRFLILSIQRCTGAFPYDELEIVTDGPNDPNAEVSGGPSPPVLSGPHPHTLSVVSDRRADANIQPLSLPVPPTQRKFAFLDGKSLKLVLRQGGSQTLRSSDALFVPIAPVEFGATGPGREDATGVAPVSFEHLSHPEEPPAPESDRQAPAPRARGVETFCDMLSVLEKSPDVAGVEAVVLDPPFVPVKTRVFGSIPAGSGRSRTWHLRKVPGAADRPPRLLLLAEIRTAGGVAYAFDLEPKNEETTGAMMLVIPSEGEPLRTEALRSIVDVIRKANRTWADGTKDKKVIEARKLLEGRCRKASFNAIDHNRSTAEEYAELVLQVLRRSPPDRNKDEEAAAEPAPPDQREA